jgi:hypothetical protein
MNAEIKKQWVDALRSGEYKQGQYWLKQRDNSDGYHYCCLGVLCDLYSKATNTPWQANDGFLGWASILPIPVCEWAGLSPISQAVMLPDGDSLASMNDHGKTFTEIADVIDLLPNM